MLRSLTSRLVVLVIGFAVSVLCAWGQSLPLNEIVSRMQAAQVDGRSQGIAYQVTRKYILADDDPKTPDGQITAQIDFLPPSEKAYTLSRSQGGDRVEKVVRKVLDHEAEMTAHADRGEVTSRNYEFALLSDDVVQGRRCYVLQLTPKRAAPELLRGKAWVDATDYKIRRLEGELAKSPSWWVKDVHVSLNYGEVLGMWMQLDSRAKADVRMLGQYVLTSQALDVRTQMVTAQNRPSGHPLRARRSLVNSAVWIAR